MEQNLLHQRISDLMEYTRNSLSFIEAKNGAFLTLCSALIVCILTMNGSSSELIYLPQLSLIMLIICTLILGYSFFPNNKRNTENRSSCLDSVDLFSCENISKMGKIKLTQVLLNDVEKYELTWFENQKIIAVLRYAEASARKYRLFRIACIVFYLFFALFLLSICISIF